MLFLLCVLADDTMDNSFENLFLWNNTLHILNEVVGFVDLVIFKVVDHQVKSSLWNNIDKGRQHLQSIFSSSEDNKIMPQQVVILEHIASR